MLGMEECGHNRWDGSQRTPPVPAPALHKGISKMEYLFVPYSFGQVITPRIMAGDIENGVCRVPVMNDVRDAWRLNKWINWNRVLRRVVFDQIFFADSDVRLPPGVILSMLEAFKPGVDVVIAPIAGHALWAVAKQFVTDYPMTYVGEFNCSFCQWIKQGKAVRLGLDIPQLPRSKDLNLRMENSNGSNCE